MLLRGDYLLKDFGMVGGKFGENLAIQFNVGFLELGDELRVGDSVLAGSGADLYLPGAAERSLFLFAVGKLEAPGVEQRFFGLAELGFTCPLKALSFFKDSFAPSMLLYASFYACHGIILKLAGESASDLLFAGYRNRFDCFLQPSAVAGIFRVKVVLVRVALGDFTGSGNLHPLHQRFIVFIRLCHRLF